MDFDFIECDSCKAKSGSPTLCNGCLFNRATINLMNHREKAIVSAWENDRKGIVAEARKATLLEAKNAIILALMDGKSVILAINRLMEGLV